MLNSTSKCLSVSSLAMLLMVFDANSAEWAIESDVKAEIEHNDNIFLTSQDHDSVTGLILTPSLKMLAREQNWETALDSRLRSNNYSDDNINSNDLYFDLTGRYSTERNVYSLNGTLDFDSNLNSESTDFGIAARRIKREIRRITPQYTRRITERLLLTAGYTYSDVDYIDADNTGFVPYKTNTVNGSLVYNLSEKDQANFLLQGVDYESKDGAFEYDLVITRFGVNHKLSESFSVDYLVGTSRRDSTSRSTQTFDFFGQPITRIQVSDFSDSGFVLDAGFRQDWEESSFSGRITRDNTTDSFGGLNKVDKIEFKFSESVTKLWRYSVKTRHEDIESIDSASQFANREIFYLEPILNYSFAKDWKVNGSYRYLKRKFASQSKVNAPGSNRISVGITYNFPSISTF